MPVPLHLSTCEGATALVRIPAIFPAPVRYHSGEICCKPVPSLHRIMAFALRCVWRWQGLPFVPRGPRAAYYCLYAGIYPWRIWYILPVHVGQPTGHMQCHSFVYRIAYLFRTAEPSTREPCPRSRIDGQRYAASLSCNRTTRPRYHV